MGALSNKRSFRTSLSLTLNLSSRVRTYTKKVQLSSVFMSRKFKSLSRRSLRRTLGTLADLTSKGHLMKVVSRISRLGRQVRGGVVIAGGYNKSNIKDDVGVR